MDRPPGIAEEDRENPELGRREIADQDVDALLGHVGVFAADGTGRVRRGGGRVRRSGAMDRNREAAGSQLRAERLGGLPAGFHDQKLPCGGSGTVLGFFFHDGI